MPNPIPRIPLPGPVPNSTSITAAIVAFPGDPTINGGLHPQWQAEFDKSRPSYKGSAWEEIDQEASDSYVLSQDVEEKLPRGLDCHLWGKAHYIEREDLIARNPGLDYEEMFKQATQNAVEHLIGLGYLDQYGESTGKRGFLVLKRTFPPPIGIFEDPDAPDDVSAVRWRNTVKNVKEGLQHCKRKGCMAKYIRACLLDGGIRKLCEKWDKDVEDKGEAGDARDKKLFGDIIPKFDDDVDV